MSDNGATQLFNDILKINGYVKINSSVPNPFGYTGEVEKLYIKLGTGSPVENAVMKYFGFKHGQ